MQWCEMLDDAEREDCEKTAKEAYNKAHDECTPKEPTECEQIADAEFEKFKNECLANGGTAAACEEEA
jgi:hypothetical protein